MMEASTVIDDFYEKKENNDNTGAEPASAHSEKQHIEKTTTQISWGTSEYKTGDSELGYSRPQSRLCTEDDTRSMYFSNYDCGIDESKVSRIRTLQVYIKKRLFFPPTFC